MTDLQKFKRLLDTKGVEYSEYVFTEEECEARLKELEQEGLLQGHAIEQIKSGYRSEIGVIMLQMGEFNMQFYPSGEFMVLDDVREFFG